GFAAHMARLYGDAPTGVSKALLDQRDRLRSDLAQVDKAIGEGSSESGPKVSADMESLFARRAELTSQISDFGRRAAEARIGTPRLVSGTQIVDAPRAVRHSLPRAAATQAAIGLALGLALGLAVAAVGAVVADRPVLRREIAGHIGASVLAELPGRSPRLWQRRRVRAARTRLTASLARTVRGSAGPVSLLELGSVRATTGIALDLAGALAADGPVAVIDGLPGLPLTHRRPKPGDPTVVSAEGAASVPHQQRRLGVGSVAPGTAWTDLQHLGTRTVLVVRAGHGSAAWLHTVARHLSDQRIEVIGVVLIDPDPADRTDGTLWEGPYAARRGEGERPARRNGTGRRRAERLPMWAARVRDSDDQGER
ncbi:polysaccharide biosynthesis protein, partial [Streptomyces sp. NPDC059810]|uniref:polysaccharide biosynthesis protein n=1 Tax=Streptomyces sp. NPDC059810 TaxID=3346956 RepID=UPI00366649BE